MRTLNRLTPVKIAAIKEPGMYCDGDGLYLQVSDQNGAKPYVTKSWVFRYMLAGRARKMGLGSLQRVSLAKAREKARALRELLAEKIDPIENRIRQREAERAAAAQLMLFKDACAEYIRVHEQMWRNEKHKAQWVMTLSRYTGDLPNRPVGAITDAAINEALAPLWKRVPDTASRTRQRIIRVLKWVRDGKPMPAPARSKRVRHHPALPYADLPAFMAELRQRDFISARALEFLILTAARTGEVIRATWDEIDLEDKIWIVPASRMKAGKEHRVPLSDPAVELLKALPREVGSNYVFPGAKACAPLSNMALLELLRDMRPGATVHGFRSTFKDWASERTSYPNIVSEAALAHAVSDKVEAAYRRGDLFEKRKRLMREWGAYCTSAGNENRNACNIVAIRA